MGPLQQSQRLSLNTPASYFFTDEDLRLSRSAQTFATSAIWIKHGMHQRIATFDLVVREFTNRNYMIFAGTEELIDHVKNFGFTESDIQYLLDHQIIDENSVDYYRNLKFTGTIYALPEGTPFFPGEPVIRITAPIIEAALLEITLMNVASSNVPFLTKAVRAVHAAGPAMKLGTGLQRAHSFESAMKACRLAHIAGISTSSMVSVHKKYAISLPKALISGQHFFIKSFPSELEAMRAMADYAPDNCSFMVDTYDTKNGIANAITVAKELEQNGYRLDSIFVDSGDLVYWCGYAREQLRQNGLEYVQIIAGTNIDEYKIEKLVGEGLDCDLLAFCTEFVTVSDSPKLEVVYKVGEVVKDGEVTYTAKLTSGKTSLPGRKQVYRTYGEDGRMAYDTIALEGEPCEGTPLLQKIFEDGNLTYEAPALEHISAYLWDEFKKLPEELLTVHESVMYPVRVSENIQVILEDLRRKHAATAE